MPLDPCLFVPENAQHVLRITSTVPTCITFGWGQGHIVLHQDGRLELEGYDTLDDAARAFWEAVQRWTPLEWTVTLPWQQEGDTTCL